VGRGFPDDGKTSLMQVVGEGPEVVDRFNESRSPPVILTKVRTQSQERHVLQPWVFTCVRMTEGWKELRAMLQCSTTGAK